MPEAERDPLYICHTLYHTYVAAILAERASARGFRPMIVTAFTRNQVDPGFVCRLDSLPWVEVRDLTDRDAFQRVSRLSPPGKLALNLFLTPLYPRFAPSVYRLPKLQNRQIFLFNDFHYLDRYVLRRVHGDVILVEDGAMTYQKLSRSWKSRVKPWLGIPPSFGRHRKIVAILANRPTELPEDTRAKGRPLDVSEQIAGWSDSRRNRLITVFLPDRPTCLPPHAALVMTQPLADFGRLSHRQHCALYADITRQLRRKGYAVWIKPHPSDSVSYAELQLNAVVLPAGFPIEILNDVQRTRIALALGVNTSAVRNIAFARKAITLLPEDVWINHGYVHNLQTIENNLGKISALEPDEGEEPEA